MSEIIIQVVKMQREVKTSHQWMVEQVRRLVRVINHWLLKQRETLTKLLGFKSS